jgi:hypothetical protein
MNHIPRSEGCVKVYADSLRKTTRLLTIEEKVKNFKISDSF